MCILLVYSLFIIENARSKKQKKNPAYKMNDKFWAMLLVDILFFFKYGAMQYSLVQAYSSLLTLPFVRGVYEQREVLLLVGG